MSEVTKDQVKTFIDDLSDELDYSLEECCPEDPELMAIRDAMHDTRQRLFLRVEALARETGVDEDAIERLQELKDSWSRD